MNTKRNVKVTVAAATTMVFGAILGSGVVWADESGSTSRRGETRSVTVQYADLDLTREEGLEALHSRLDAASKRVCGDYELRIVRARQVWQHCYDVAMAEALEQIGHTGVATNR